ncbi:allergen Tha p 1-like [Pieris brassicae]|nr:allergen Tha p 1-like [Pieris brassicae]XP_045521958.1 allergen Tha p 1-like [Pieris brassicae]
MAGKLVVFCCCVLVAVFAEKYTDKYDNINLQEILENGRLFHAYINCLLDKGKCSPEGKELRDHIQDALETGCSKCTEAQEKGTYTIIEHLINKEKEIWEELCAKYDAEGKYRKKYEERAKSAGLTV